MDKSSILSAFNDHFTEFVEDVQRVFPDNTDISTLHTAITKVRKMNPKLVIKVFHEHVISSYSEQIENGDIHFFINNDYKNDLTSIGVSSSNNNMILEKIDLLRDPVRQMGQEDQAKVMKYLQNLTKLCKLYSTTF